jgi:electron transfer flavoprotein beta subunit
MRIVVFIKQVPDNTRLRFQNGQPVLAGTPTMMNPFDEYALETALRLKEQVGGDAAVTAVSMGADSVREILKKAVAAGADQAFLLSDPLFAEGDSASAAVTLARAAKQLVPDFNLLIFGQAALDDASAQTGPRVAELLDLPSVTYAKNAQLAGDTLAVFRETERGTEEWAMSLPGVLCMMKCDYELRSSNIKGVMRANKAEIPVMTAAALALDAAVLKPVTRISKLRARPAKVGGRVVDGSDPKAAVSQLLGYLQEAKVL